MASIPSKQKAVIFNTNTDLLSFTSEAPVKVSPDQLFIKVHTSAITTNELKWKPWCNWPEEQIPTYDVAGTVVRLPTAASKPHGFKVGDKIYGRIMAERLGSASEYANILTTEAAVLPKGLDVANAATVPMSANTAWQALFEQGLLTGSFTPTTVPHINSAGEVVVGQAKGKRVLILGAAGAVGLLAVQFAKLAGAYVVGTASGKQEAFLKSIGLDEMIDYTKSSIKEYIENGNEKFDLVFGCGGSIQSGLDGWNGPKDGATYVSVVPGFGGPESGEREGIKKIFFIMEARGEELGGISKLFEKGLLKTKVDSVWALEDFQKAFDKANSGRANGKVVFKVSDE